MENGVKARVFVLMMMVMASLFFSACGGSSTTPAPTTYTIGGTVSGLSGTGLVLQDNGGNNLPVSANGAFTFTAPIANGGAYRVAVLAQPSSPAQSCVVTNGSGTASSNVTSVEVACVGEWTWVNGANVVNQPGTYGTQGTAAFSSVPGAGDAAASSTDAAGNLWLFGGDRYDSNGTAGNLNDLWKYSDGEWTWVSGSNVVNQLGTYGTQGTAAPGNVPGARSFAASWTDSAGDFWLFGGSLDLTGTSNFLNDLWKYSAGEWTWMGGANTPNQPGTYGTQGIAAPSNVPGARGEIVTWIDADRSAWLFGGKGSYSASDHFPLFNDLWKYSAGEWTWVSGANVTDQPGTYGTQGTAAPSNVPGARFWAVSWTDASGNFWLFGGIGYGSTGTTGFFNDLWKYSAGEWTWMGGSDGQNQQGTYGTQGITAASNIPGARYGAVSWTDAAGDFWLFGGNGYDSAGTYGFLNDLWKYSAGEWTWMGGAKVVNQAGTYGTQGTTAPSKVPGARGYAVSWTDAAGNFWLFGGGGYDSAGTYGGLNDLWEYKP